MGQALYRKHRSKKLSEIVGQEHITTTLNQALKTGKISHAYLFTGPRGTGKTSIARILAHEINGLPYVDDSMHIDIIEIDAASNRRIDEIRELREKVYVAPTSAKYKVYIIDEVHMLTREAFNALLKTLEEPPAHVVFILATTDAHKLPATIISRTQRFSFKPVEQSKVVAHLQSIASAENITIDAAALELIAAHGEGSFRDSISLLDQASNLGDAVSLADVQLLLGMASGEALQELLDHLVANDQPALVLTTVSGLYDQGYQPAAIASQLATKLRDSLLVNEPIFETSRLLDLLRRLLEVPLAFDPERFLEISLLQTLQLTAAPAISTKATIKVNEMVIEPKPVSVVTVAEPAIEKPKAAKPELAPAAELTAKPQGPLDTTSWPQVLQELKKKYNTLYGVVRMAQPTFNNDGSLTLAFGFAFHQKRINEAKNRQIVLDTISSVTGQSVKLDCIIDTTAVAPKLAVSQATPKRVDDKATIAAISNIFGGGELLE